MPPGSYLVQMPTGCGKTATFTHIPRNGRVRLGGEAVPYQQALDRAYLALCANYPNERSDKRQAAVLKKMGVKRGVPDLCLPVARGQFHGLYIEMKRSDGGTVSDDPLWWIEQLIGNGYASVICDGWESGKEALLWYLNLASPPV